jgi:hypothetical protein
MYETGTSNFEPMITDHVSCHVHVSYPNPNRVCMYIYIHTTYVFVAEDFRILGFVSAVGRRSCWQIQKEFNSKDALNLTRVPKPNLSSERASLTSFY